MPSKAVSGSTQASSSNGGASHLTPAFLAKARKFLRKEVDVFSGRICKDRKGLGQLTSEKSAEGERESNEHHFIAGMELNSGRLKESTDALESLYNGTYGICEECGGKIPAKRIETMKFKATLCVECKGAKEVRDKHTKPHEAGRY